MSFSPPIPRVAHRPYPSPQYLLVDPLFPTSKDLYRALGSDNDPLQPLAGLTLLALILSCPFYASMPVYGFALLVGLSSATFAVHVVAMFFAVSLPLHHALTSVRLVSLVDPTEILERHDTLRGGPIPAHRLSTPAALSRLDFAEHATLTVTVLAGLLAAFLFPVSALHFVFFLAALGLSLHYARLGLALLRVARRS